MKQDHATRRATADLDVCGRLNRAGAASTSPSKTCPTPQKQERPMTDESGALVANRNQSLAESDNITLPGVHLAS